jgi:hypothetical protein
MAEVDPRFDPVFQRGYDPARHGGAFDEGATAPPPDATLDDPPPRRIRYRLVLLLASAASLLAAGALIWHRITADPLESYYGSNPGILFRLQLVDSLVTPLLVAGLTGVILWLALGALRRRDDA